MIPNNFFYQEALDLTKRLVSIPSLNGTEGERHLAEYVKAWLQELPYFQKHPRRVFTQMLNGDSLRRMNVFALVRGERSGGGQTIILHGHCDTVGIEDFGSLRELAFDCEALPEQIRAMTSDPEVLEDIASGEWLFGRGACDMKCGIAVLLCIVKYVSLHPERFDGNVLFMLNPVEENQHTGIMEALDVLEELREARGLRYQMAINTDFFSPAYPGDCHKYLHAGAVGKILPCFYVLGAPTHVGHAFEGFSATLAAAEIVRRMELRAEFADAYNGELTLPPLSLRCRDTKPSYNVTSPPSCFLYFNYFIHNQPISQIMARLRQVAQEAMEAVNRRTDGQYRLYCRRTGGVYRPIAYPIQVLTYSQLHDRAAALRDGVDQEIRAITERELAEHTDPREIALMIVEKLCGLCRITTPTAVVFLAPPFCPRNTMKPEVPEERSLLDSVRALVEELRPAVGEDLKLMQFFPVLTDSSYLKIDDDPDSIREMIRNFPNYEGIYNVPLSKIKSMNIPAFNFGCFGKDGHKWTERVHLPYTFGKLPAIIYAALEKYLISD